MKKDIEWLKSEIGTEMIQLEPNRKERWSDVKYQTLRSVAQKINQLDETEVLSQEWIDNNSVNASHDGVTDEYVHVDDLKNLLVPTISEMETVDITEGQIMDWLDDNDFYHHATAETVLANAVDKGELGYYGTKYSVVKKPVIPKYVADWIEEVKDKERTLYGAIIDCPREVDYWLIDGDCSNQETFARAWLDGYTVKKEQKYYARIKGWELFADFVGVQYWGIVSIYGRLGFVSADDAKDNTKDEWKRLGIDDSNAEFVEVV